MNYDNKLNYRNINNSMEISDRQQSWGYEDGPLEGAGAISAGGR